jgi:hypothetical protein
LRGTFQGLLAKLVEEAESDSFGNLTSPLYSSIRKRLSGEEES